MHSYTRLYNLRDDADVHKNTKRGLGQYPVISTKLTWSIKDLLYEIPRLHVALCFYFCVSRILLQNVFLKLMNMSVFLFPLFLFLLRISGFSFSSSILTEKLQEIFLLSQKIFCEEMLPCTHLNFCKILLKEKKQQRRAGSIAPSGPLMWLHERARRSESEHSIRCILPTRGACDLIKLCIALFSCVYV